MSETSMRVAAVRRRLCFTWDGGEYEAPMGVAGFDDVGPARDDDDDDGSGAAVPTRLTVRLSVGRSVNAATLVVECRKAAAPAVERRVDIPVGDQLSPSSFRLPPSTTADWVRLRRGEGGNWRGMLAVCGSPDRLPKRFPTVLPAVPGGVDIEARSCATSRGTALRRSGRVPCGVIGLLNRGLQPGSFSDMGRSHGFSGHNESTVRGRNSLAISSAWRQTKAPSVSEAEWEICSEH